MTDTSPILPGATLGRLGGGQLGRMFAAAAAQLGYRVHVLSPHEDCPTSQVAHRRTVADYEDAEAVARFAQGVDVVTLEFENVPAAATETAGKYVPVRPSGSVLHITQNRIREKRLLQRIGVATAPYAEVSTADELSLAIRQIGVPAVLKTADSGYNGKGQSLLHAADQAAAAWTQLGQGPCVLEGWVNFQRELSLLVARDPAGEISIHGPILNHHVNHILDVSLYPVPELEPIAAEAEQIGYAIAQELDLIGLCCIEFFLTGDHRLLVNEIAPRPHNSGHLTIEASTTSQFDQQVRAICGLPLGSTAPVGPAAMVNLLGHLWQNGEPDWPQILADDHLKLHLYGKTEARPGRKMGHLTVLATTTDSAVEQALAARARLEAALTPAAE